MAQKVYRKNSGMGLTRERQVLQLLRDYRSWHTAYGGSLPPEDSHIRSASYGSAAYIPTGAYFEQKDIPRLEVSFSKLRLALKMLYSSGYVGKRAYLVLLHPYLSDPADPGVVTRWRQVRPGLAKWHDFAIRKLATYLAGHDLYVVFPSRMTSNEEKRIEQRNDELFGLYERLRGEGIRKTEAVNQAALLCGYGKTRAWEIVGIRESSPGFEAMEA